MMMKGKNESLSNVGDSGLESQEDHHRQLWQAKWSSRFQACSLLA